MSCADPESFVRVVKSGTGILDSNTAIHGPSSARQLNAIKMAFRWLADDGPTLNADLVAL